MIYVITQTYQISPHIVGFNGDLALLHHTQSQAHSHPHLATSIWPEAEDMKIILASLMTLGLEFVLYKDSG